jgi:predicted deacetylase
VNASLLVSIHDVAPSTAWAAREWAAKLDRRGVPTSLLVVPGPWEGTPLLHDRSLVRWLRGRVTRGDEVLLHGWTHRAPRTGPAWRRGLGAVGGRGAAEFFALDAAETSRRLALGQDTMRSVGLDPAGFTPPGWLASPATPAALRALGFRYWTSHRAVHDLATRARHPIFALSHRPRSASEPASAWLLDRMARRLARDGNSVRLALHPDDLSSGRITACTLGVLDAALEAGAVPRTYGELVASSTIRAA